jgi:hypothetical protein
MAAKKEIARYTALSTTINKLIGLMTVNNVNQYAFEGGQYEVTAADKAEIQEAINALQVQRVTLKENLSELAKSLSKKAKEGNEFLDSLNATNYWQQYEQTQRDYSQAPADSSVQTETKATPWGTVGPRNSTINTNVKKLWAAGKDTVTYGEIKAKLVQMVKKASNLPEDQKAFNRVLARQLKGVVPDNVKLVLVSPDTPLPAEMQKHAGEGLEGRGIHTVAVDGAITIYIKDGSFVQSGLTEEVILHELVHAATLNEIDNNPNGAAVKRLKALMKEAREAVADNAELSKKYEDALIDVGEFVAYGMTNTEFQRDVLMAIASTDTTVKSLFGSLRQGMRQFVDILLSLVMGDMGIQSAHRTGMGRLLVDVTKVMDNNSKREGSAGVGKLNFHRDPVGAAQNMGMEETFQALGFYGGNKITGERAENLSRLLRGIVGAVHGSEGILKAFSRKVAENQLNGDTTKLDTKSLRFADQLNVLTRLSHQEMFALESLQVALKGSMDHSSAAYSRTKKLYNAAKESITPQDLYEGDWANTTKEQKRAAKKLHSFIFTIDKGENNRSDYLSRFAAIGLVHPKMNSLLAGIAPDKGKRDITASLAKQLMQLGHMALEALGSVSAGSYGYIGGNTQLEAMAITMAQLHSKHKDKVAENASRTSDPTININAPFDKVKEAVVAAANSDFIKGKDGKEGVVNKAIAATGKLTRTIGMGHGDKIWSTIKAKRDDHYRSRLGIMSSILDGALGDTDGHKAMYKLLTLGNKHERARKEINTEMKRTTKSFLNDGLAEDLTDAQESSITRAFVRTDLRALLATFSEEQISAMIANPKRLESEIKKLEDMLKGKYKAKYKYDAKALGYFLATDYVRSGFMLLNAHNISRRVGSQPLGTVNETDAKAMDAVIDPLVSLYALRSLPTEVMTTASQVFADQQSKSGPNGIFRILQLHQSMSEDILDTAFHGNPTQMMKGYTKELLDSQVDVQVVDETDVSAMVAAGFEVQGKVEKDPSDYYKSDKYLVARTGGAIARFTSGAYSRTGERAKGSTVVTGISNMDRTEINKHNLKIVNKIGRSKDVTQKAMTDITRESYRPEASNKNHMVPVINEAGQVTNWRYLMSAEVKDTVLNRDNRVSSVMGAIASHTFDKAGTVDINETVTDALKIQYDHDRGKLENAYIEFGPNSSDPQVVASYHLLPEKAKEHIRKVWGSNTMQIRNDLFDMTVGYRAYTLTEGIEGLVAKDVALQNIVDKTMLAVLELVPGLMTDQGLDEKTIHRIRRGEEYWQDAVRAMKDNVVIKNVFTLSFNIMSNGTLLLWMGVSPADIAKHHITAIRGLYEHENNSSELRSLQIQLQTTLTIKQEKVITQRITQLEDALERNPVNKLIQEGMLQTIVEDIDTHEDLYSNKSSLSRFMEDKTKGAPDSAKKIASAALLLHEQPIYKILNKSTQWSDFVARYTLHEHMTNKKKPMKSKDSIELVMKAFINYDIPQNRTLQYMNDVGLLMFTKYLVRVQNVLLQLWQHEPARGLALVAMSGMLPGMPTIMDSAIIGGNSDPLEVGAFGLPGTVDDIAPINMMLHALGLK